MNQNARKDIKTLSGYETKELEHLTMTKARESWHIFGIISEFVQSADQLANIRPAVSIFGRLGSNRTIRIIRKQRNWLVYYRMQVLA